MSIVAAGLISLAASPAHAQVPEYDRFEIPSPEPQEGGLFGERMRTIGDVDGDGARDVLIASNRFDDGDAEDIGRVYVYSGRTRALLDTIEPPDPQAGGKFGFWSASLGTDVDEDGVVDFVISAPGQEIEGEPLGKVYVYSGRTRSVINEIEPPESLGTTGPFGGDFGGNVIGPGDLNGDGSGDFVATASGAFENSGAAFAFDGKTGEPLYTVSNPSDQPSSFGFGLAELGDINGDDLGDYQVGAPRFEEDGIANVGRSYIVDGEAGDVIYELDNPEPEADARFGQADADGISLGDITGDGTPDIYVDSFLADATAPDGGTPLERAGKVFLFDGADGELIRRLRDPIPTEGGTFGASNASAGDLDKDGRPDSLVSSRGGNNGRVTIFGGPELNTVLKTFEDPQEQFGGLFGSSIASLGDVNGDGAPDYFISSRLADVDGVEDVGTAYAFISQAPPQPPPQPQPQPEPQPQPQPVSPGPCGTPGGPGYLNPAKMRVSRARVLREDRELDLLAPITTRARGAGVAVTYQGDGRSDTFDAEVTDAGTELDEIRIMEEITRGQAELGTGIVNLRYLGDADTRPELVRLRAASQRAELEVEEISLVGDRLSATGSVTDRAEGVVRLLYSYVSPDGSPAVHEARAEINDDGGWEVDEGATVPPQLAQCGGYLSVQFTGFFERRIRGEQLGYELNAGQTRNP